MLVAPVAGLGGPGSDDLRVGCLVPLDRGRNAELLRDHNRRARGSACCSKTVSWLTGDLIVRVLLMLVFLMCGISSHAEAHTLRSGDTIDVSVWQDSKLDRRVVICPTGMI